MKNLDEDPAPEDHPDATPGSADAAPAGVAESVDEIEVVSLDDDSEHAKDHEEGDSS